MRILIGATFAILVAALAYKFIEDNGGKDPEQDEIALLKARLDQMEKDKYRQPQQPYVAPVAPYTPPAIQNPAPTNPAPVLNPAPVIPDAAQTDEAKAEVARLQAQLAEKNKALEKSKKQAELNAEEGNAIREEVNRRTETEEARAAIIMKAKVFAVVKDYDSENRIIQLEVQEGVQIQEGRHLCIRRGEAGGIAGRIMITSIQDNITAFADPLPGSFPDRKVDVQIGDEIIIDMYK